MHTSTNYRFLILAFLVALSPTTLAEARVVYEAQYEGRISGLKLKMTRQLIDLGDGKFMLKAGAKNFLGSISESEKFIWSDSATIQPLQYRYQQKIFGVKKKREIDFDWQKNEARAVNKKQEKVLALNKGVLGPMSSQLMLQLDLLRDEKKLTYRVVSRNQMKEYNFIRGELLPLSYKNQEAVDVLPLTRSNEGATRQTTLLFDPQDNFNLVLIKHTKGDDSNTLVMTSARYFPPLANTPFSVLSGI